MVTYRTTDNDRWGAGKGSNLEAAEVDTNFWDLLTRIVALETNPAEPTGIASFTVAGSQMTVHMSDGTTHGPLTLPTALIRFRCDWTAATAYFELDLVTVPGDGLYLVLRDHTSGAGFDPVATDGEGNLLHRFLLPMENATSLAELSDVSEDLSPFEGDVLMWDGTAWDAGSVATHINNLGGVNGAQFAQPGQVLALREISGMWEPTDPAGSSVSHEGALVLAAPSDIDFAGSGVSVADDGDGTITITVAGGTTADLADVSDTAPVDGQALIWDADDGLWEPRTISPGEGGVSTTVTPSWHGARASFAAMKMPTAGSLSILPFSATTVDTDAFVSGSSFVIPPGVTKARLSAMFRFNSGSIVNTQFGLIRDGAFVDDQDGGFVDSIASGYSNNGTGISSGVLDVAAGEVFALVGTAASTTPTFDGWFEIEVVEGALLDQVVGGVASISGEGVQVLAGPTDINFVGAGVVVTDDGDGSATVTIVDTGPVKATPAEVRSGAEGVYVDPAGLASAAGPVVLTDDATIAVDWSAFITAEVMLAGNRTLGDPTNGVPGTWRTIILRQDGTGSRALAFGSAYRFPGGTAPALTAAAGATDVLRVLCVSATEFFVFAILDMG